MASYIHECTEHNNGDSLKGFCAIASLIYRKIGVIKWVMWNNRAYFSRSKHGLWYFTHTEPLLKNLAYAPAAQHKQLMQGAAWAQPLL